MAEKNTSPEEYQELGRRYYRLKQYEKAIEVLSQGINTSPTLGLYDHRAATYDKLNEFSAAVKDGRAMIMMNKKAVTGYLRTASALEKMEKPETALGIYKYGMKNVPTDDQNFKVLQQLHDRLTRKLSPATARDPLTVIPIELAEMILEYLSFRQMVNCMRVSRGWRDYLSHMSKLWMHLDLSGARRPVPRSFVAAAVKRSDSRLTRLTIHRFEHTDMLTRLAKVCKSLTELEIITLPYNMATTFVDIAKCSTSLRKYIIHPEIKVDTAQQILQYRPELHHVAFNKVHLPTRLGGNWPDWQTPALESLSLTHVLHALIGGDPTPLDLPLKSLVLNQVMLVHFPSIPPTVQRLVINLALLRQFPTLELLACRLPALSHLTITELQALSGETLESLLDLYADASYTIHQLPNAIPLQSLTLRGLLDPSHAHHGLFKTRQSLFTQSRRILTKSLQSLDISTMPCDDDEIAGLLTHDTGLETINLSHTNISGASIKMLADGLPTLRSIHADGCRRINGREAIAYAERKGIAVSYRMEEGKGGRKVRYG
ncbi:similar to F-box domain-containing protein [Plenodomus lingam JN3]|uniref:Similar to F-box domain-containing protein n=1 Tax=Leptosphaeria maculans (strain JN3 / isolate v23.1.3 / race Av1-4-5-6-7-8) TaxID=985895 RepID=E5A2T3_LEPMJ|nr:similar to F-box domain-containing protein [Plenodomus lingam JN3]CBX97879.1 similar to F-box domain-containing protein [Plenodomus lingam JN3]